MVSANAKTTKYTFFYLHFTLIYIQNTKNKSLLLLRKKIIQKKEEDCSEEKYKRKGGILLYNFITVFSYDQNESLFSMTDIFFILPIIKLSTVLRLCSY